MKAYISGTIGYGLGFMIMQFIVVTYRHSNDYSIHNRNALIVYFGVIITYSVLRTPGGMKYSKKILRSSEELSKQLVDDITDEAIIMKWHKVEQNGNSTVWRLPLIQSTWLEKVKVNRYKNYVEIIGSKRHVEDILKRIGFEA